MAEDRNQFAALERLMAEEQTRRQVVQRRFWVVVSAATLAFGALVVIELTRADRMTHDPVLLSEIAKSVAGHSELQSRVAASELMQARVHDLVVAEIESMNLARIALEGDEARELVQSLTQKIVEDQLAASRSSQREVEYEVEMHGTKSPGELNALLSSYEARLEGLAAKVEDPTDASKVADLGLALDQLRRHVDDLSEQVACAASVPAPETRTFMLKSRNVSTLPGLSIVVSIGSIKADVIDSVALSGPDSSGTQGTTRVIGRVPLGRPLAFEFGGISYEGTFTYAQKRFLNTALIGLDLRTVPSAGECESTLLSKVESVVAEPSSL